MRHLGDLLFKLLQVYPEGKMSQHFASLKPGDVVEVKGYVFCNKNSRSE